MNRIITELKASWSCVRHVSCESEAQHRRSATSLIFTKLSVHFGTPALPCVMYISQWGKILFVQRAKGGASPSCCCGSCAAFNWSLAPLTFVFTLSLSTAARRSAVFAARIACSLRADLAMSARALRKVYQMETRCSLTWSRREDWACPADRRHRGRLRSGWGSRASRDCWGCRPSAATATRNRDWIDRVNVNWVVTFLDNKHRHVRSK